jgi:hypothetical protein
LKVKRPETAKIQPGGFEVQKSAQIGIEEIFTGNTGAA